MNAAVQHLTQAVSQELNLCLVGQNFTTGQSYCNSPISLDFFAQALKLGHEVEVQNLYINGFNFYGNEISGYAELNSFINQLNELEDLSKVAVIHAVLMDGGLVTLEHVFEYVEKKVLSHILNADDLGMSDLREKYGQQCSEDALDKICKKLPTAQAQQLALYWNHQQFIDDLFINEVHFISRGKVQVIVSNR